MWKLYSKENRKVLDARKNNPHFVSRRENIKRLRHLAPLGVANGWLKNNERQDDEKIFNLWKQLAEGELASRAISLSEENFEIIGGKLDLTFQSQSHF